MLTIFAFSVLGIFTVLLLSRAVLLLGKLRDGGDGFLESIFWYVHLLLIIGNIELNTLLCLSYLYFSPGTVNPTPALVALLANAMIAVRAFSTRRILFGLAHLPGAVIAALWAFPTLEGWLLGLF